MPKNYLQTLIALISPQRAQVDQSVKYGEQLKQLNHLPRSCIIYEYATTLFFLKFQYPLLSLASKGEKSNWLYAGAFPRFFTVGCHRGVGVRIHSKKE